MRQVARLLLCAVVLSNGTSYALVQRQRLPAPSALLATSSEVKASAFLEAASREREHALLEPPAPCGGLQGPNAAGLESLRLVHITKTGGTTIEKWGAAHHLCWGVRSVELRGQLRDNELKKIETKPVLPLYVNRWHIPPRFFVKSPYQNSTNFAVVRNPYTRAISEFRCPFFGFGTRRGKLEPAIRANVTVKDLNRWLQQNVKDVRGPYFKFAHLLPQHIYISDTVDRKHVLRVESLGEDFAALIRKFEGNASTTSMADDPLGHDNDSEMRKFTIKDLEKKTIALINEVYDADFEMFDYQKL